MGDVDLGRKIFVQRCAHCHSAEAGAKHKQGPNLFGLYGNKTGQAPRYSYTDANLNRGTQGICHYNFIICNCSKWLFHAKIIQITLCRFLHGEQIV